MATITTITAITCTVPATGVAGVGIFGMAVAIATTMPNVGTTGVLVLAVLIIGSFTCSTDRLPAA